MEQRVTPSGITGAAAVIGQLSLSPRVAPFQLTCTGISVGQTALPDGTPVMLNIVHGQATLLGQFQGQILLEHSQGESTGTAFAYLFGNNGAILRMTLYATGGNGPNSVLRGRYEITGGVGRLAGATGAGTIVVMSYPHENSFTIEMQGQIAT
jgi:hypothetical protein